MIDTVFDWTGDSINEIFSKFSVEIHNFERKNYRTYYSVYFNQHQHEQKKVEGGGLRKFRYIKLSSLEETAQLIIIL